MVLRKKALSDCVLTDVGFFPSQFVAVVMAVGGVILFAYEDGFDAVSNVLGVVLSVGSAVGAAFYKVMHVFCA